MGEEIGGGCERGVWGWRGCLTTLTTRQTTTPPSDINPLRPNLGKFTPLHLHSRSLVYSVCVRVHVGMGACTCDVAINSLRVYFCAAYLHNLLSSHGVDNTRIPCVSLPSLHSAPLSQSLSLSLSHICLSFVSRETISSGHRLSTTTYKPRLSTTTYNTRMSTTTYNTRLNERRD